MSPRNSIGCVQNDFYAYCTIIVNRAPIFRQDYHSLQTDRIELPLEPRQLGVASGASKMISEPMVSLAQTMHLSNTVSKRTDPRQLGVL